ncbi:MAG: hypothetical protein A3G83_08830 [Betaproteobacteria bacterium RIFCSPLOWO2_12_FULL_68_20]|nr:MAG: hypothetical protein A3G83_08830 [Betaproteobacteria bacterium RIFCSPLOWO2_12_FULL_68_20]
MSEKTDRDAAVATRYVTIARCRYGPMIVRKPLCALLALVLTIFCNPAYAQGVPPERGPLERPRLPEFLREAPRPGFVLPPLPASPERRPSRPLAIVVKRFRIVGATVFDAAQLEALLAPFTGRSIGNDELEEARLAITRHYVAAGYVNSGALIPDQEIRDGVATIEVIEGRLAEIVVAGEHRFEPRFFRERVAAGAGPPLNVRELQERMQVILLDPQIERINAELGPGVRPGEAVLRLDVTEAKRNTFGVTVANNRSPVVGAKRVEAQFEWRNLLGRGEAWGLRQGLTSGLEDTTITLSVPLTAHDTRFNFKFERSDATVVEPPFDLIAIRNRSEALELGLVHPFVRTVSRELALGATLARRRNASFLLGQPFSFTPGLDDGKSAVAALRVSGDWSERSADQVLAARFTVSRGLDHFGATISNAGNPDSRFVTRLAQLQWARRLPGELGQLVARGDWQRSNDALLPSEKFALGGAQTVRGYRENAVVRDNGWVGSVEYRRPIGRLRAPLAGDDPDAGQVEIALFADAGSGRDHRGAAQRLSSFGAGLRWTPVRGALAQVYKGFAQRKIAQPTRDLQDSGVHFLFAMQVQF